MESKTEYTISREEREVERQKGEKERANARVYDVARACTCMYTLERTCMLEEEESE